MLNKYIAFVCYIFIINRLSIIRNLQTKQSLLVTKSLLRNVSTFLFISSVDRLLKAIFYSFVFIFKLNYDSFNACFIEYADFFLNNPQICQSDYLLYNEINVFVCL